MCHVRKCGRAELLGLSHAGEVSEICNGPVRDLLNDGLSNLIFVLERTRWSLSAMQ